MAGKTTKPTKAEFDAFTDEDFELGVQDAGKRLQNRYVIRFPWLWVEFHNGSVYRLPINPSKATIQSVAGMTPVDQMVALIASADSEAGEKAAEEDDLPLVQLSYKYAETLARVQGASLGKSSPSSD